MKKFLTILLTLLSIISYSQTKLDIEIFNVINQYRVSNGLNKLDWRQDAFGVVKKHNDYMRVAGSYSHDEPIDIPNHKELNTPGKRFTDADIWWNGVGENIMNMFISPKLTNLLFLEVYHSDSTLPFISKNILSSWVASPGQKRLLLDESMEFGAVSISLFATKRDPDSDIIGTAFCTFSAFR